VPLLGDSKCFQKHVVAVSKKSFRRACGILRETLKPLCLRRTRGILGIASPIDEVKDITFSKCEAAQYQWIMNKGKRAIDAAVSGHAEKGTRNIMLKLLLKLRILCNQGTYTHTVDEMNDRSLDADEYLTLLEEKEEAYCTCCFSSVSLINQLVDPASGVLGECSHMLCSQCYEAAAAEHDHTTYECPACDKYTRPRDLHSSEHVIVEAEPSKHSSKLDALIQDLLRSQEFAVPEKR
jgi:SWI/SNF-related matrix-associated actin-dependent regulator of chromatin subfamily A3